MGNFDHYVYGNFELFSSFSSSVQTELELIIHWSNIRGGGPLNNVLSGGATSTHSPSYPIPSKRDQEQVFTLKTSTKCLQPDMHIKDFRGKHGEEMEAMKVWEQMRANDDDVEVVGDNAGLDDYNFDADADHDHNDYGGFEGVGGDEGSAARGIAVTAGIDEAKENSSSA